MALDRMIFAAGAICALGVSAPLLAPALLQNALLPHGQNDAASDRQATPPAIVASAPASAPDDPPPPVRRSSYSPTVALRADQFGQFETQATINGHTIPVVVDTGATTVALSTDDARRLGIVPAGSSYRLPISTANGVVFAAPVTLADVSVGGILVRNVQAVVVPSSALGVNLLGMTFLSRLSKFEMQQGELVLSE